MMKKLMLITALGLAAASQAGVIDNFDSYTVGDSTAGTGSDAFVDNSGPWTATSTGSNTAIENGNYLSIGGGFAKGAYRGLGADALADGDSGTYYYQVSSKSLTVDYSCGLSDAASVTGWGDLEAYVNLKGDGSALWLAARDAGATTTFATGLSVDTWYDVWLVVDNSADTYDVYYGTGLGENGMGSASLGGSGFSFRNGAAANDLGTFGMYGQLSDNNAFEVDSIAAVPEPATLGLVAMFGGVIMLVRRRLRI